MFALVVTIDLYPGAVEAFMPLVETQARNSVQRESGCLRFDVVSDPDRPGHVMLYELYRNADAFETHLQTDHFKTFDAKVADLVRDKQLQRFNTVMVA